MAEDWDTADGTNPNGGIDVGRALRSLRRAADLSQRELAQKSGVPQTTIANIESGAVEDPKLRTVERLVGALGARLSLTTLGQVTEPAVPVDEERRDNAGRRYPAHLDPRKVMLPEEWWGAWWAASLIRDRWPLADVPEVTFDLVRSRRDERRARLAKGGEASLRRVSDGSGFVWLAELADGTPVGVLHAHVYSTDVDDGHIALFSSSDGRMVVLDDIRVRADYRHCGIGRRLVDALIEATDRVVVAGAAGCVPQLFLRACGFDRSGDVIGATWFACRGGGVTSGSGGR